MHENSACSNARNATVKGTSPNFRMSTFARHENNQRTRAPCTPHVGVAHQMCTHLVGQVGGGAARGGVRFVQYSTVQNAMYCQGNADSNVKATAPEKATLPTPSISISRRGNARHSYPP